jgi:hypothetical protein
MYMFQLLFFSILREVLYKVYIIWASNTNSQI